MGEGGGTFWGYQLSISFNDIVILSEIGAQSLMDPPALHRKYLISSQKKNLGR